MYPELNRQRAFTNHPQNAIKFKNSNFISSYGLWLPTHPKLEENEINRIKIIVCCISISYLTPMLKILARQRCYF